MKIVVYICDKFFREIDNVREIRRSGDYFRIFQYGVSAAASIYVSIENGDTRLEITSYPDDYPF